MSYSFADYSPGSSGVNWLARYRRFRRQFVTAAPGMSRTEREARICELADLRAEFPDTLFRSAKP